MGPRRAEEGKVSPRWPRMAAGRLLEVILVSFEGLGGHFGAEAGAVLVAFSDIFSVRIFVSVSKAIGIDLEAHFGYFFMPEGAREAKTGFTAKSSFPSIKHMFARGGGLPRSSKSWFLVCFFLVPLFYHILC